VGFSCSFPRDFVCTPRVRRFPSVCFVAFRLPYCHYPENDRSLLSSSPEEMRSPFRCHRFDFWMRAPYHPAFLEPTGSPVGMMHGPAPSGVTLLSYITTNRVFDRDDFYNSNLQPLRKASSPCNGLVKMRGASPFSPQAMELR